MLTIHSGARVLFDGDSVTDCGRDRQDRHSLSGYNDKIARNAHAGVEFFNRGISGDRSKDLLARIESDLRDTKPDVVSILIGINDTWRRYDENDPTTALAYEQNMRGILKTVRAFGAKIILLEPFLLPTLERFQIFREDLDFKIDAARKLAREFADAYVPLDGLFAEETLATEPALLSFDSVHPTELGNEKIARWWLERAPFRSLTDRIIGYKSPERFCSGDFFLDKLWERYYNNCK